MKEEKKAEEDMENEEENEKMRLRSRRQEWEVKVGSEIRKKVKDQGEEFQNLLVTID